jgi:hypothetical protein
MSGLKLSRTPPSMESKDNFFASIKSSCPGCLGQIEIPATLGTLICSACGAAFHVRRLDGSVSLSPITVPEKPGGTKFEEAEQDNRIGQFLAMTDRLSLIEEDIDSISSDIELIRSKEQGAPLQLGCALFGMFGVVVIVLGVFSTVGRALFGGWLFYLCLAAVLLVAIKRLGKKLMSPVERRSLAARRARLQSLLEELLGERDRIHALLDQGGENQSASTTQNLA